MSSLKTVAMEPWIMRAYQGCIAEMAKSEDALPIRLADAVCSTLYQDDVLTSIPPSAKDHMHEWIFPILGIDLWKGESLLKFDEEKLRLKISALDAHQSNIIIEHIIAATSKITAAVIEGGYKVPNNA